MSDDEAIRRAAHAVVNAVVGHPPVGSPAYNDGLKRTAERALRLHWPSPVGGELDPRVREALEFYADEASWNEQEVDHFDEASGFYVGTERVPVLAGPQRAREALALLDAAVPLREGDARRVIEFYADPQTYLNGLPLPATAKGARPIDVDLGAQARTWLIEADRSREGDGDAREAPGLEIGSPLDMLRSHLGTVDVALSYLDATPGDDVVTRAAHLDEAREQTTAALAVLDRLPARVQDTPAREDGVRCFICDAEPGSPCAECGGAIDVPQPPPGAPLLGWLGDELWAIARCEDDGEKFVRTLHAHWPSLPVQDGEGREDLPSFRGEGDAMREWALPRASDDDQDRMTLAEYVERHYPGGVQGFRRDRGPGR